MICSTAIAFTLIVFTLKQDFKYVSPYTITIPFSLIYFGFGACYIELTSGIQAHTIPVAIFFTTISLTRLLLPKTKQNPTSLGKGQSNPFILFFCLISFLLSVFQLNIYGLPIFNNNVEISRTEILHHNKLLFYNMLVLSPYCSLWLSNIKHPLSKPFLLFTLFITAVSGFRSITLNLILLHFLLSRYRTQKPVFKLSISAVLLALSMFLFVFFVTQTRIDDGSNPDVAIKILLDRLFLMNLRNIDEIIQIYNNSGLLMGEAVVRDSSPLILRILSPFGIERLSTFAEFTTAKTNPLTSDTFTMTPTFIGPAFADFGLIGIVFHSIALTSIGTFIQSFRSFKSNPPTYCFFCYIIAISMTRGLFSTLALYGTLVILIHIVSVVSLRRTQSKIYTEANPITLNTK